MATATGLVKAKESYDNSNSVKKTVTKLIGSLEKLAKGVKSIVEKGGGRIRDTATGVTKRAKVAGRDIRESYNKSLAKAKSQFGDVKDSIKKNGLKATLLDRFRMSNNTSTDPPFVLKKVADVVSDSTEFIRSKGSDFSNLAFGKWDNFNEHLNRDTDLDQDPDGEPSERGYLKMLLDTVEEMKNGDDGGFTSTGKDKQGWFGRWKDRRSSRKDQIAAEKERVKNRGKKKGRGGILGWLFGAGLFGLKAVSMAIGKITWGLIGGPIKFLLKNMGKLIFKGLRGIVPAIGKLGMFLTKNIWKMTKSFTKVLGKGLGALGRFITPKWLSKPIAALGGKIGALGKTLTGVISNLGSTLTKGLSGLGKYLGSSKLGGAIKSIGSAVFGKGSILRTIGSAVVQVGARVVGAFVAAGPIGWAIGIGLALWGGYKLYKYFKDGKGKFPDTTAGDISYLRMYAYGLTSKDSSRYVTIFEIEEIVGRFASRDSSTGDVVIKEADEQGRKDIADVFGLSKNAGLYEEGVRVWLSERFVPAYREFLRVLWNVNEAKKAGDLDTLSEKELSEITHNYNVPSKIWDIYHLPFKDKPESDMTRDFYDDYLSKLRAKTEHIWTERQAENAKKREINTNSSIAIKAMGVAGLIADLKKKGEDNKDEMSNRMFDALNKGNKRNTGGWDISTEYGYAQRRGETDSGELPPQVYSDGNYQSQHGNGPIGNTPIDEAIRKASELTGIPADVLWTNAKLESGLTPNISNGSARGLNQIVPSTWAGLIKQYGGKYGLTLENSNINDPLQNTLMIAEYMKSHLNYIQGHEEVGLDMGLALYMGNFLGNGGVRRLIKAMKKNPNAPLKDHVGETSYNSNEVMHGKTIQEFVDLYKHKWAEAYNTPSDMYPGYRNHRSNNIDNYNKVNLGSSSMKTSSSGGYSYDYDKGVVGPMQPAHNRRGSSGLLDSFRSNNKQNTGTATSSNVNSVVNQGGGFTGFGVGGLISTSEGMNQGSGNDNVDQSTISGEGSGKNPISVSLHPIKAGYEFYFTSLYGKRNTGIPGASTEHGGVDMGVPSRKPGTPIVATGPGKVIRAAVGKGYGNVVYLAHPDGLQTRYAHLDRILVRHGQQVERGQVVGLMGSTGVGSGVHLHFEVRRSHAWDSATIDPFEFPVIRDSYKGPRVTTTTTDDGRVNSDGETFDVNQGFDNSVYDSMLQNDPVTGKANPNDPYAGLAVDRDNPSGDEQYDPASIMTDAGSENYSSQGDDSVNLDVKLDATGVESAVGNSNEKLDKLIELMSALVEQGQGGGIAGTGVAGMVASGNTNVPQQSRRVGDTTLNSSQQPQQSIKFDQGRGGSSYLDSFSRK